MSVMIWYVVCCQLEDITGRKYSHRVNTAPPIVRGDSEVLVKVWEVLQEGKGPFVVNSYHFPTWGDMTEGVGIIMYESLIHVSQNSRQEGPDFDLDDESVHMGVGSAQPSPTVHTPAESSPQLSAQPHITPNDSQTLPPAPSMPPPPPPPPHNAPSTAAVASPTSIPGGGLDAKGVPGGPSMPPPVPSTAPLTATAPTRNLSTSSRDASPTAIDRPASGQLGNLSQYIGIFNQLAPRRHSTTSTSTGSTYPPLSPVCATASAATATASASTESTQKKVPQTAYTGHNGPGFVTTPTSPPAASSTEDGLPPGWEQKLTPAGKCYYVNHVSKTTQWERPDMDKSG